MIKRFEDLEVWQLSRVLVKGVYEITPKVEFQKDFGLKDQVRRCTVSIMANISEGFERKKHKKNY
jgi:four helix bundle protein